MSLIVVDDCPSTRQSFVEALRPAGLGEVYSAASGSELFHLLSLTEPTAFADSVRAVLLDVGLPGLDGLEICRTLRAAPHLSHIPVLLLTGGGTAELENGFAAGATDFLTKPVVWSHLLARLRALLHWQSDRAWYRTRVRMLEDELRHQQGVALACQQEASRDGLTALPNRRSLDRTLEAEWRRAAREAHPITVVMVDVDYFKAFNDRYGHPAGDACLTQIARCLQGTLHRSGDLAARYGGEEFTLLLPNTDLAGGKATAEAARAHVEALTLRHEGRPDPQWVTISLGVAAGVPGPMTTPDDLVAAADRALYRAKRAGRNQVAVCHEMVAMRDGAMGAGASESPLRPGWRQILKQIHETSRPSAPPTPTLLATAWPPPA